ncbi:Cu-binding protein [Exophiala dermatitidis]|nr:Cu-binding protein [Exophiala dermatitidis]KAJ4521524.1 Cu-binding protein [Exophiala dermatitidis]KAJ4574344.1 Cu-binding protein [Exophiala dermatitidis]KAJ4611921.1 Cu-binding protein [Exophiala dermatitidis]KAJ4632554.1 Cu-binding protein [Exophiala dermatitidis]
MPAQVPSLRQAMRRLATQTSAPRCTRSNVYTSIRPLSQTTRTGARRQTERLQSQCTQQRRAFSSTGRRLAAGDKLYHQTGPFSFRSAALFVGVGAPMVFYFQYEKARLERKRITEMSKGYGKPKVGGPFTLKDVNGNDFTEKDLLGKYSLIYFGFTHCPDICPDELDKMGEALDIIQEKEPNTVRPIFISCDPNRDTPEVLKTYLAEFHPSIMGLVGTWQQTKDVCKQYRVYFSTPPKLEPGEEDYLVDHSIYFYVMDPEGDFVECIGRQDTPESAAAIVLQHIRDWKKEGKPLDRSPLPYLNDKQKAQSSASSIASATTK